MHMLLARRSTYLQCPAKASLAFLATGFICSAEFSADVLHNGLVRVFQGPDPAAFKHVVGMCLLIFMQARQPFGSLLGASCSSLELSTWVSGSCTDEVNCINLSW
jgi:hypothetical protein